MLVITKSLHILKQPQISVCILTMNGAAQMFFVLVVQLNKFDILIVIAQSSLSITSWTDPVSFRLFFQFQT